jgi:hypothetical protein
MDHARFLLDIEREGKPTTYNHYFSANLSRGRTQRMRDFFARLAGRDGGVITLGQLGNMTLDNSRSNPQQVREDIHDILKSYYKVSRKRFVDVVCQQVVHHFLLDGAEAPLNIFSPDLVMRMNDGQLEMIAGEDAGAKRQRQLLGSEIERLEAAMKVLRS